MEIFSQEEEEMGNGSNKGLIAYRLGRVEKAVEQVERNNTAQNEKLLTKLESFGEIREQVVKNTIVIESLLRSRDRLITAVAAVATGMVMIILEQVFNFV